MRRSKLGDGVAGREAVALRRQTVGSREHSAHVLDINRSRKTTLVIVTHDPELASVADLSIALRDGRVARVSEAVGS